MQKLNKLVQELEGVIPSYSFKNETISHATVGWQIEHSLKTIDLIVQACQISDPKTYRWKFKFSRFLIMTLLKKIPRGKARAPKVVLPVGDISTESLDKKLQSVKEQLNKWNELNDKSYFQHPYFGALNKKATLRFLELHTEHHCKIIRDILS